MIAIPNKNKPKNAFECSTKINPEERMCIYTGKVFEETLSLLLDCPCDDCPLIDIVTCGECKWWNRDDKRKDGKGWCENVICGLTKPNAFCSYGERKPISDERLEFWKDVYKEVSK